MNKPTNDDLSNASRAKRCHTVLRAYNQADDTIASLTDFLADARHWCDEQGLDFAELDRVAYGHYACERASEKGVTP